MRSQSSHQGFTLIEFAAVIVISGLLMAAAIQMYYVYVQNMYYQGTIDKLNAVYSSMSSFASSKGRFPCPSDPTVPFTQTAAGLENFNAATGTCTAFAAIAINTCNAAGSMCKVDGARDTLADLETVNPDPVLIGGLPYKTIKSGIERFTSGAVLPPTPECYSTVNGTPQPCDADSDGNVDAGVYLPTTIATFTDINMTDALDPWGYQMGYAVTQAVTNPSTYGQGQYGAINVQTEDGTQLLSPAGNANYVIVSYGPNHMGAYTSQGVMTIACVAGTVDAENCDNDSLFTSGLRVLTPGANYYDDVIKYSSVTLSKIWEFVDAGSNDIYNKNFGNVGVGTTTDPAERLEVNGNIKVSAGGELKQNLLCDTNGTNCWSPNLLGGPVGNGNQCPAAPSGTVNVMTGITNGQITCTAVPLPLPTGFNGQSCTTPGEFVIGFSSSGIICGTP
jgi:prepilin-type N-terminal cleavage/methylation domain-containing protein